MSVVEEVSKGHVVTTSSSVNGIVITMNAWVDPSNTQLYIKECQAVQKKFVDHPDNLFCALSVNPKDTSHVRIVHGWKGDSEWFGKTFYREPWFEGFVLKTKPLWIKDRVIEHFDLVPLQ